MSECMCMCICMVEFVDFNGDWESGYGDDSCTGKHVMVVSVVKLKKICYIQYNTRNEWDRDIL